MYYDKDGELIYDKVKVHIETAFDLYASEDYGIETQIQLTADYVVLATNIVKRAGQVEQQVNEEDAYDAVIEYMRDNKSTNSAKFLTTDKETGSVSMRMLDNSSTVILTKDDLTFYKKHTDLIEPFIGYLMLKYSNANKKAYNELEELLNEQKK